MTTSTSKPRPCFWLVAWLSLSLPPDACNFFLPQSERTKVRAFQCDRVGSLSSSPRRARRQSNAGLPLDWKATSATVRFALEKGVAPAGGGPKSNRGTDGGPPRLGKTNERSRPDAPGRRRPARQAGASSPRREITLNSQIHRLRKTIDGLPLAQQRLEDAIEEMRKEARGNADLPQLLQKQHQTDGMASTRTGGDDTVGSNDDSLSLLQFPDTVSFNAIISSLAKNADKDRSAAHKAEGLLRTMLALSNGEEGFAHLRPTTFTYNAVMEAYFNSKNRQLVEGWGGASGFFEGKQQSIARLYQELKQSTDLSPNTYTWNLVLASTAPDSEDWTAVEAWALDYLVVEKKGIDAHRSPYGGEDDTVPDRQTYSTLLKRYAQWGDADRAEVLLRKLLDWNRDKKQHGDGTSMLDPSKVWFHCVLKALSASKEVCASDSGERASYIIQEMAQLSKLEGLDHLQPDSTTFNHVLNIHALRGDIESAMDVLEKLEQSYDSSGMPNQQPDCVTYTTVIKAHATVQQKGYSSNFTGTSKALESAESAMAVFERMRSRSVVPSIVTYNTMIAIWANVGTRDALKRAENLLGEVRYPDSISLATLIHGWSRTRFAEAGYRAQELFNQLLQLPPSRQKKSSNITTLCNSVIVAFAKSGESTAPQRAESLLSQLEGRYYSGDTQAAPDKTTFLCVFDTYAKAGIADAEKRCDALLNRMYHIKEVFQLKDLEADRAVYNAILNALAKSQQSSAVEKSEEILTMMETSPDPSLRPDIVTYSTVIDCHTKCGEKSTDRAEEILRYVEGTYRCGDKTLKPNAVFYSAILQCWAKTASVEGAEKAEELLRRNIGLYEQGNDWAKPHTIVFNAVMDAIARSGLEDSGRRADALLQEMESSFQAGDEDLRPSRRSFNAVMMAHRKDGNASKAEAMLYRMEDMAESKGRPEVRPNVVSYNTVIGAIVEDSTCSDNAADRAQALLDRMEAHNVRPDGRSYSPVIEGWLRRNDEKGARVAEAMLSQFLEQVEESKKRKNSDNNYLYEHEVWDVINAYRKTPNRTITSHIF